MKWEYNGANVQVPSTADIPPQFRSRGIDSDVVQGILDAMEPWRDGDDPIKTVMLEGRRFMPIVVPLLERKPQWGIYAGHHAKAPQASPFVRVNMSQVQRTSMFTIELTQSPRNPKLVRAYPGEYIPPLPWMSSAAQVDGGVKRCEKYWRKHAFIFRQSAIRSPAGEPRWFRR